MSDSPSSPSTDELQSAHPDRPDALRVPLIRIFQEAFILMARYFIILYPLIFFYIIGMNLISPIFRAEPDLTKWSWWAILLGVPTLGCLLRGGWQALLYQCIREWQFLKTQLRDDETHNNFVLNHNPLAMLKHFVPGVGEYGLSILVGNVVWLILAALPLVGAYWWAYTHLGVPPAVIKISTLISQGKTLTEAQLNTLMMSVTPEENMQIGAWGLYLMLGMGGLVLVNLVTYFWQQYLVIRQCNPFRAMLYSIRHLIRYPLQTLVIFLAFFSFTLFTLFIAGTSVLGSFFAYFMFILMIIYAGLFNFLYLDYLDVKQDLA